MRELTKITMAAFDLGVPVELSEIAPGLQRVGAIAFLIEGGKVQMIGTDTEIPESGILYTFDQETLFTRQNIVNHTLLTVLHPEFFESALIDLAKRVQIAPGAAASGVFTFYVIFDMEIVGSTLQGRYLGVIDLPRLLDSLQFP